MEGYGRSVRICLFHNVNQDLKNDNNERYT